MSGFWGSLFGGSNDTLKSTMDKTGKIGDFATSTGEESVNAGTGLFKGIVSGDATKTAQVLAPLISSAKTSNQQTQKTNSVFGTRSGGTAASNNASSDKVHSDITNATGNLTGAAANTLLSSGEGLTGMGLGAYRQQTDMSQLQIDNWQNSIFGGALTGGAAIAMKAAGTAAAG